MKKRKMKKGTIKKIITGTLSVATMASFYLGLGAFNLLAKDNALQEKQDLLKEFRATEEYQMVISKDENKLVQDDLKIINMETEDKIIASKNEDYNKRLEEVNEAVIKFNKKVYFLVGNLFLNAIMASASMMTFLYTTDKYYDDGHEIDEEYSHKLVIV